MERLSRRRTEEERAGRQKMPAAQKVVAAVQELHIEYCQAGNVLERRNEHTE